jgi:hypothetical protein
VLNRREKIIAVTLAGAVALLVADRWALTPYLQERERLARDLETARDHTAKADHLLHDQRKVDQAWRDLTNAGLTSDVVAGENQALHAVRDWAQANRIDLQTIKTDRPIAMGDFQQIRLQVTGAGPSAAVSGFLYAIETAKVPMHLAEFRANSRKPGTDDLAFSLTVSTIVFSPAPPKPVRTPTPKAQS